jgi:hypothetical protein
VVKGTPEEWPQRRNRDPSESCCSSADSGLALILYLLGKGYRVLQVENRAVKDYREKVFGSETKADEMDARLMARVGFLHELVGEEFSIRPVHLTNPDAAALKVMVGRPECAPKGDHASPQPTPTDNRSHLPRAEDFLP